MQYQTIAERKLGAVAESRALARILAPSVCSAMRDSDWKIRRRGRAWRADEFHQRMELWPGKREAWKGRMFWSNAERVQLLGLLLESVGVDRAVKLGDPQVWREAIDRLGRAKE